MRTIAAPALTALIEGASLELWVEMLLTQPARFTSAARTIEHAGKTWIGVGILGSVEAISDTTSEHKPLRFSLSAVSGAMRAIAEAEPIRNKPVTVYLAILNKQTRAVLDTPTIWTGTLDQMPVAIDLENHSAIVNVIALHAGVGFAQPKPFRYTDADQQRVAPGDTSHRFIVAQSQHRDVWPAASYHRA